MSSADEIVKKLKSMRSEKNVEGMKRFGIVGEKRLGVSVPHMRRIAKEAGKDHKAAISLWRTGIPEAMIVASMIDVAEEVTEEQMDDWVKDLGSWDVCDQVCMNLFDKTPFAWKKVKDWSGRDEEFVKRAAFALIACIAWHDKDASDERFTGLLPLIKNAATDDRNFVKKAVNWALRHIGKRNLALNRIAIDFAQEMEKMDSKAARWIAKDALRELKSDKVQERLKKAKT